MMPKCLSSRFRSSNRFVDSTASLDRDARESVIVSFVSMRCKADDAIDMKGWFVEIREVEQPFGWLIQH